MEDEEQSRDREGILFGVMPLASLRNAVRWGDSGVELRLLLCRRSSIRCYSRAMDLALEECRATGDRDVRNEAGFEGGVYIKEWRRCGLGGLEVQVVVDKAGCGDCPNSSCRDTRRRVTRWAKPSLVGLVIIGISMFTVMHR